MPDKQQIVLSEEQVAVIEARANAATESPWEPRFTPLFGEEVLVDTVHNGLRGLIAQVSNPARLMSSIKQQEQKDAQTRANAEFIAHAREDVPALCQTVRALQADNKKWQRAAGHWKAQHEMAESRLAQAEKERDALRKIAEDALRFRVEMNGSCNHDEHMTKLCTQCEIRELLENLDHKGE